jgi:high-affinity Fe2+/Pb2+ permease
MKKLEQFILSFFREHPYKAFITTFLIFFLIFAIVQKEFLQKSYVMGLIISGFFAAFATVHIRTNKWDE